jgi:alpha-galactosidase
MSKLHELTPTPPMGWNSFDSYGCVANEEVLMNNLEAMSVKLKDHGYLYFVVDNGWFAEYLIPDGARFPIVQHAEDVKIDAYGRYVPSNCHFPNGFKRLIDRTHELGLKFGIHLMRGISRKAVDQNLPIHCTSYRARDIANTLDTCDWCQYNYGVDMSKPGAQEFYNSIVNLMAAWGVDFIKADDITGFPEEIDALVHAIEQCGRDIILSLSPGDQTSPEHLTTYARANMLRTTSDIWDNRNDLSKAFEKWAEFQDLELDGCWLDLDMIPFGHLQVWKPKYRWESGPSLTEELLNGKGSERMSGLTTTQKLTFITMRAMAASPLFMGGDLVTSDVSDIRLITQSEMLQCNQNGIVGRRVWQNDGIEVWVTAKRHQEHAGWLGIFNRNSQAKRVQFSKSELALRLDVNYLIADIWKDLEVEDQPTFEIEIAEDGVRFWSFKSAI